MKCECGKLILNKNEFCLNNQYYPLCDDNTIDDTVCYCDSNNIVTTNAVC